MLDKLRRALPGRSYGFQRALEVLHLASAVPLVLSQSCPVNILSQRCPLIFALSPHWLEAVCFVPTFTIINSADVTHGLCGQAHDGSPIDVELIMTAAISREGTVTVKNRDPVS